MTRDEFVYYFELEELELLPEDRSGLAGVRPECFSDDITDMCEPAFRADIWKPAAPRRAREAGRDLAASSTVGRSERLPRSRRKHPVEPEEAEAESNAEAVVLPTAPESKGADPLERPSPHGHGQDQAPATTELPKRVRNGPAAWSSRSSAHRDVPDSEAVPSPAYSHRDLISVHVLGQFAFCDRAGIYAAEHGEETDADELQPRLDFLPNFDLERIEEQLSLTVQGLWGLLILLLLFASAMVVGAAVHSRQVFYPALAGCFICLVCLPRRILACWILVRRRAAARQARAREPEPTFQRIEPVNWWSMLKAGFEPVSYRRQIRHPVLPLEGNPWRVLERGSLRIPVIKSGGRRLGDAKHAKHEL